MPGFPIPEVDTCADGGGGGGGGGGLDIDSVLLCDTMPDGEVVGAAIAVYEYDAETGLPTGPPTFVDPVTGDPYVPTGTLLPCSASASLAIDAFVLCDDGASGAAFLRHVVYTPDGDPDSVYDTGLDGLTPYVAVGDGVVCGAGSNAVIAYESTIEDITGAPQTILPGGDLVGWTLRNRDSTDGTFQINGGDLLEFDVGETVSVSVSTTDANDLLEDTIEVDPGDGTIRATVLRRV